MFLNKLLFIKTLIFDVDGVLTDGLLHVNETGDQVRQFHVKDGYALQLALKRDLTIIILSGAKAKSAKGAVLRLKELGIQNIFIDVKEKLEVYKKIVHDKNLFPEHTLYMGDDMPDLPVMKLVGLAACPADAVEEIKAVSHYISPKMGGKGCVRDIIEKVLKAQNKWHGEALFTP